MRTIQIAVFGPCILALIGCASGPTFTDGQTTRAQMEATLGQPIEVLSIEDGITRVRWPRETFRGVTANGAAIVKPLNFYDGEFGADQVLIRWRAVSDGISLRNALGFDMPTSTWAHGYLQHRAEFPPGSFLESCAAGSPEQVETAIAKGADVNQRYNHGQTPLMVAAHENEDSRVIAVLIHHGAEVNAKSNNGSTPLTLAASENERVIPALIAAGANVNAQNDSGKTSLWLATWNRNSHAISALIKASANPNLKDDQRLAPLAVAALRDNAEAVPLLMQGGATVDANDGMGTALQLAVVNKRSAAVVEALLKAGANANLRSANGKSLLDIARQNGSTRVAELLIDAGAKE